MKRFFTYLILGIVFFTLFLTGCGKEKNNKENKNKEKHIPKRFLVKEVVARITSILPMGKKVWFTTARKGLFVYDFDSNQIRNYNKKNSLLPSNHLYTLAKDPDAGFWVGGERGISYFDGKKFKDSYTDLGIVNQIIVRKKNGIKDIWLATVTGLQHLEGAGWKVYDKSNSGLLDTEVKCVAFGDNDSIWCGGEGGLHQFFPKRQYWQQYLGPYKVYQAGSLVKMPGNCGLPANQIYSLDYKNKKLWVATNGGVACYQSGMWVAYTADHREFNLVNEQQKMVSVPGNSPLSGNWIYDVKYNPERKEVYIGTDKGLSILTDNGKWSYINKENSPLPSNKIKSVAYDKNYLYLGSYYGLVIYEF